MILDSSVRYRKLPQRAAGRRTVLRNSSFKAAELEIELHIVEQEIESIRKRARELANELGARYAVFRCTEVQYDDGRGTRDADIMTLSRQTDSYIQSIYNLEDRRKELLHIIGK